MDLKSFLPDSKGAPSELYWSLVIEPEWIQAGIWHIKEGGAEVVSIGPTAAWMTDEELVDSADAVLSAAIQKLPEDVGEPSKTVFGVSNLWVSEGQIKPEYLEKIKTVCSKLSLEPVGFVVLSEAVSHFVKSEEGSPLNAVVVGFGKENMEISLFRLGNQSGTTLVARSVSPADDIAEGLSRFSSGEPFPSRVILYDGKEGELDETRQSILAASWEGYEKVKFLHTPKVEIFSPEKKVTAVCLAGASEIAKITKISSTASAFEETAPEDKETPPPAEVENVQEVKSGDLGFVFDKDIASTSQQESLAAEFSPEGIPEEHAASLPSQAEVSKGTNKIGELLGNVLALPKKYLKKLSQLLRPERSAVPQGGHKNPLIVGGIFFILLLIFGFIFWWYYPKAKIVLYISPKNLEESTEFSVMPGQNEVDLEGRILPGEIVTKKEVGDKTSSTTGTKTVGERAKGEVKLFRSGSEVKLDAGTELTASGNLVFTLDSETTIASGSASTPGTTTAKVTAAEFGSEYNLASGASFGVGNYPASDIEAKNESAFSGGSSREINAVSEEDQEKLEEELLAELSDKALGDIESSISDDEYLIKESLSSTVGERTFGNKVGDEASNLKLSLSIEAKALVIKREQLMLLAQEILKDKVASGFVLREDQIKASFELVGEDNDKYQFKLSLKANLLPELKIDEITTKILGKYPPLAKEYLAGIEGFSRAEVTLKPQFPGRLGIIPRVRKNITIEIAAEN